MSLGPIYVKATSGKYCNAEAIQGPDWTIILNEFRDDELTWKNEQPNLPFIKITWQRKKRAIVHIIAPVPDQFLDGQWFDKRPKGEGTYIPR